MKTRQLPILILIQYFRQWGIENNQKKKVKSVQPMRYHRSEALAKLYTYLILFIQCLLKNNEIFIDKPQRCTLYKETT